MRRGAYPVLFSSETFPFLLLYRPFSTLYVLRVMFFLLSTVVLPFFFLVSFLDASPFVYRGITGNPGPSLTSPVLTSIENQNMSRLDIRWRRRIHRGSCGINPPFTGKLPLYIRHQGIQDMSSMKATQKLRSLRYRISEGWHIFRGNHVTIYSFASAGQAKVQPLDREVLTSSFT